MSIEISQLGPAAQKQIMEKLAKQNADKAARQAVLQQEQQKKSKYNAQPDSRGAIRFDSKKEARRYDELMIRLKAGRIQDLKLQPQFTLQESYVTPNGERIRAIRYNADFSYFDCDLDKDVVEDVKSKATKTRVYEIKKKLLMERFGIEITEV